MTQKSRHTGSEVASSASKVLRDDRYSAEAKSLAASALSQASNDQRETSAEIASLAGEIINDPSYSQTTQEIAASVLSQRAPKR
jgi:hypothetical protein